MVTTTKMSSKGQVVIPEQVREEMNLKAGSVFVVLHHEDTVILKIINEPSPEQFSDMLKSARSQAKKAGIKKSDVRDAIKKVRRTK